MARFDGGGYLIALERKEASVNAADDFEERSRDRRTPRLFDKTTNDSSNVGRRGHRSPRTWAKWYAKYGPPLVQFIGFRRSKWKDEAPDVVQEVAAMIADDPYITDRGEEDKYRTVLCRLCIKVIDGKHNAHREIRRTPSCGAAADAERPKRGETAAVGFHRDHPAQPLGQEV